MSVLNAVPELNLCEIKKQKLLDLVFKVVNDSKHKEEIAYLLQEYGMDLTDVIHSFLHYNLDINEWNGNKVYELRGIRFVMHIHNLIHGSWHQERQETMINFIKHANVNTIADIAFGVPSKYVKYVLTNMGKSISLSLYDNSEYAFEFAEKLLNFWNKNWRNKIKLLYTNMDELHYIGDFDLYVLQDSIEHTKNPDRYLDLLVDKSPHNSKFLMSIPIGPLLSMHYKAWETTVDAINWVHDHGLEILRQKIIYVNPKVDLFTEQISPDFSDLYLLCTKVDNR